MLRFALTLTLILNSFLSANETINKWLRPVTIPQPSNNKLTDERVSLGKFLFFDTRLSIDNSISCATCHHPSRGWTELIPVKKAIGFQGRTGPRNTPSILNGAYQKHHFWDGRVRGLEAQSLGPIETSVEMNMPLEILIPKLNKIPEYVTLFELAYPKEGLTQETLAKAIASFERTIVSTDSPFDKYIKGDNSALTQNQKDGFKLFQEKAHCIDCHDGWNFTDGSFQNIGLNAGELKGAESGRYTLKERAAWYGAFKTPTLRDVTKSYPYFHDGSVETLEEATLICSNGGRYKNVKNLSTAMKDRELTKDEINKIVSFMKSLTGPDLDIKIPTKFPQ